MAANPPLPDSQRLRHWITDVFVIPRNLHPSCKYSGKVFVDEELICNLPWIDNDGPLEWSGLLLCDTSSLSTLSIKFFKEVEGNFHFFNFPPSIISEVDRETGVLVLEVPEAGWVNINLLTPAVAERLFPDELKMFHIIDGVYDSLNPSETTKYLLKSALQFANLSTMVVPESTAKVTFLICMRAWDLLEERTEIDDTLQEILRGFTRISDMADIASQASSSMLANPSSQLKESINGILALIEDVSLFIVKRYSTDLLAHISHDETETKHIFDTEAYLAQLVSLQTRFYESWSPTSGIAIGSTNVVGNKPSSGRDQQASLGEINNVANQYEILKALEPLRPSGYDPAQACMDGTREAVLNRIITWTQNHENSESFMWISGQAGIGKTSVATSLCRRLDSIGALAGSFFCRHDDPGASDPLRLINNLVYEIAMQCPAYAQEVANAIHANQKLCNSHLSLRFEGLVKKPLERLRSLSLPAILVMIVDGLDECGNCDSRRRILHELYHMSELVPWLKVIITARPEGDLVKHFRRYCSQGAIVRLQSYDASDDIRAYTQDQLGELALTEQWPDGSITELCTMAEGVFLWAALATKYLKESSIPSLPRLRKVLENRRALRDAMKDSEEETIETYTRCIGAILASERNGPLKISDLQHLLLTAGWIEAGTLEQVVVNLGPLVLVTDSQYVRFYHSSFKDYAIDSFRSHGSLIQLEQHEAKLAEGCLKVMQKELRFNICDLETSHLLNEEMTDLNIRINTCIGAVLKYSCIHWIDHFMVSSNQNLVEEIRNFIESPRFLYWIEVLSLVGRMDTAISALSKLASLVLTQLDGWNLITFWAKDARRFLLLFYEAIAASTPHLYISALAFAPTTSLISQRMRPYFPNTIRFYMGPNLTWHPCVKSITHSHPIHALSISPNGKRFATGYSDGSLGIWDAQTGTCVHTPLVGHSTPVICITFSPNSKIVASSSYDTTIRLWDFTESTRTNHVLIGHSGPVHAIAYSPSSPLIATGSSDKTIRLWNTQNMQPTGVPYISHSGRVTSLAFSPDGTRLVSGSWDKTIRIWSVDLGNLHLAANPLLVAGSPGSVTCLVFSPDGSRIASGSSGGTMLVWDTQTGSKIEAHNSFPKNSNGITSLAFSPGGNLIASSSSDGAVQVWDASTFAPFTQRFGHRSCSNGVAFSPDGDYVISGSTDKTTRIWELNACHKRMAITSLLGHSALVYCVGVSTDGTRIISGSNDNTVRMWDAQNGTPVREPFIGHSDGLNWVAFSPDGTQVVSASDDKTLKLWDTKTHKLIHSYEHNSVVRCSVFSADGAMIVLGSADSQIHFWDPVGYGMINDPLEGHSRLVLCVTFSPDGAWLVSGSGDTTVIRWNLQTHKRFGTPLTGHNDCVRSVDFSPCGTMLASGSDDQTIRVWDFQTGSTIHKLEGHSGSVRSAIFSSDGFQIVSGSDDRNIRLRDAQTGRSLGQPLSGHSDKVFSTALSPSGCCIISGSRDRTVRVWPVETSIVAADPADHSPSTFCWPANPLELSCHPHHPGWVTNDLRSLYFWLPAHYRQPDQFLSGYTGVPTPQAFLDYSNFKHGTAWTEVACDSIRHGSG